MRSSSSLLAIAGISLLGLATSTQAALVYNNQGLGFASSSTGYSFARGLNENNVVVGSSSAIGGSGQVAFTWTSGTGMTALPSLAISSIPNASAQAINDSGIAVGFSQGAGNPQRAARWNADLTATSISTGFSDGAASINNAGVAVGTVSSRAVFWTAGSSTPVNLALPANTNESSASSINNAGMIGGSSSMVIIDEGLSMVSTSATVWNAGTIYTFTNSSESVDSNVAAINNNGLAAVQIFDENNVSTSILWNPVTGTTSAFSSTGFVVQDINDSAMTVGQINGLAALGSSDGSITLLNSLINDPTWNLTYASEINNAGAIVGYGTHNGQTEAFLMTAVPEPASLGLLGIAGLMALRRKRMA